MFNHFKRGKERKKEKGLFLFSLLFCAKRLESFTLRSTVAKLYSRIFLNRWPYHCCDTARYGSTPASSHRPTLRNISASLRSTGRKWNLSQIRNLARSRVHCGDWPTCNTNHFFKKDDAWELLRYRRLSQSRALKSPDESSSTIYGSRLWESSKELIYVFIRDTTRVNRQQNRSNVYEGKFVSLLSSTLSATI
jgi:hypothetical protein